VDEGGELHLGSIQENAVGSVSVPRLALTGGYADAARHGWLRPLLVALGTTFGVTALSYLLPENYAATGVGLAFLGATYFFALRRDDPHDARHYGLALGGLLEPEPLAFRRLLREGTRALLWAVAIALVVLPPFWIGYLLWWKPPGPFLPIPPRLPVDDELARLLAAVLPGGIGGAIAAYAHHVLGQVLVIGLPEEAFYRGYLQTAFDDVWRPRWRVLGALVGPGLLVTSALFALGHVLTKVDPNRLAVFFPSLLFGWLRARTGGVGAPIALHALCNLFASFLGRSYGFGEQ
jgi:membrane protease YdiL (CAAX protease family)